MDIRGAILRQPQPSVVPAKAGTHCADWLMFYVYILSSKPQGTLYVGNTDNLVKRVFEHKSKAIPGFTATYGVNRLVWFEPHETRESAWSREKQIKEWKRAWKVRLIEETNPGWLDLYEQLRG